MSNPDDTTRAEPVRDRMIRKPTGNGRHFYWRRPDGNASRGWVAQRSIGTRFTPAELDDAISDILPADLPHLRVVRLKPKAAPPVETQPKPAPVVPDGWTNPRLDLLAFGNVGHLYASAHADPGTVAFGEVVTVRGQLLTVREINGDLVQLNNKPHGL